MNSHVKPLRDTLQRIGRIVFILIWLTLLYLIASNIQAGWLYVVITLFFMVVLISLGFPALMLRGLEARVSLPGYMERGAGSSATLTVCNPSRRPRYMVRVDSGDADFRLEPEGVFFAVIPPRCEQAVPVRFVAGRRGRTGPGTLILSSGAPVGIFQARRALPCPAAALVYPSLIREHGRDLLQEFGLHEPGPVQRPLAARDPYHYTLREYRPGDSLRDIHWKLTARRNVAIVRMREQKVMGHASVLIDNLAAHYPGPGGEEIFEKALERGLSAVRLLLFDFGYTVTVSGTAAPPLVVFSESEWERALSWFALVRLEDAPPRPGYGDAPAASADIAMSFGAADSRHAATKAERDIMA